MSTQAPPLQSEPVERGSTDGNLFRDPACRNYLFIGLSSLLIVAAVMFLRGGIPAALIPVLVALLGLLARWTAMPGFFLLMLSYLLVLPFGVPLGRVVMSDIPKSHFRIDDLVLAGAVLTYFLCQYRLYSLTFQGMPIDKPVQHRHKKDRAPRRPGHLIAPEEIGRMFAVVGVCIVIGQILWWLISELRIDFREFPHLRIDQSTSATARRDANAPTTRFMLLAGLLAFFLFPLGITFWYWRLSRFSPAEARMSLLDTTWQESRREINRQEKWRASALDRLRKKAQSWKLGCASIIKFALLGVVIIAVIFLFWYLIVWYFLLRDL